MSTLLKNKARAALHIAVISLLLSGLSLSGTGWAAAGMKEEAPPSGSNTANPTELIQAREIDVTGDGKLDSVGLVGMKLDAASPYYAKLFIVVLGQGQNQVVVPLEGGYNPKMSFCDFNGDKLPEIFVSAETGGSGGLSNYYLYSLKGNVPTALPLPDPLHVTSMFKSNYAVKLKVKETGKSFKVDLKDKKADYDQFGVYNNGKLIKPVIVDVHGYGLLQPMDIDRDGVCELRGVQRITGISNADTIGYVNSLWKWKDGKWVLKNATIKKTFEPHGPSGHSEGH